MYLTFLFTGIYMLQIWMRIVTDVDNAPVKIIYCSFENIVFFLIFTQVDLGKLFK